MYSLSLLTFKLYLKRKLRGWGFGWLVGFLKSWTMKCSHVNKWCSFLKQRWQCVFWFFDTLVCKGAYISILTVFSMSPQGSPVSPQSSIFLVRPGLTPRYHSIRLPTSRPFHTPLPLPHPYLPSQCRAWSWLCESGLFISTCRCTLMVILCHLLVMMWAWGQGRFISSSVDLWFLELVQRDSDISSHHQPMGTQATLELPPCPCKESFCCMGFSTPACWGHWELNSPVCHPAGPCPL